MPIVKTSYDTHDAFLVGLKNFATTNGWTTLYDELSAKGQLGLSKGNCHVSIGLKRNYSDLRPEFIFDVQNAITGVTEQDHRMCLSLATSNVMTETRYWGNPGQLTRNSDDIGNTAYINDVVGPFPNVWFFTDGGGNYIHVVLQRTADRYISFTFGNLDVKGMTVPACGYAGGSYYVWWPTTKNLSSFISYVNNCSRDDHSSFISSISAPQSFQAMIPTGVLNPIYSWATQPFVTMSFVRPLEPYVSRSLALSNAKDGSLFAHMRVTGNQTTTGGIPLHAIPVIYKQSNTQWCWLGELPDIRLVNIENLSPAQEISYGADTWIVFPWKQKGRFENSSDGSNPTADPNTLNYGIAIRKVT